MGTGKNNLKTNPRFGLEVAKTCIHEFVLLGAFGISAYIPTHIHFNLILVKDGDCQPCGPVQCSDRF